MAMALFMDDEQVAVAENVFDAMAQYPGVAPALWTYEVANSVLVAVRKGRIPRDECQPRISLILGLALDLEDCTADSIAGPTIALAMAHNLTVYDAAYLELAIRLSLPLATLDRKLAQAARAEGIEVIGG